MRQVRQSGGLHSLNEAIGMAERTAVVMSDDGWVSLMYYGHKQNQINAKNISGLLISPLQIQNHEFMCFHGLNR